MKPQDLGFRSRKARPSAPKLTSEDNLLRKHTFSLAELSRMPTIDSGHFDNLKGQTPSTRLWVSRMTRADGAPYDNQVTVEVRGRAGDWVEHRKYQAHGESDTPRTTDDEDVADAIILVLDSDRRLHDKLQAVHKHLRTFQGKGKYDHERAQKLISYVVEDAAKEHGKAQAEWHEESRPRKYSPSARRLAARYLADRFLQEGR